jgi:glycosyltransferase involved in cell wall biosynthesis
LQEHVQFKGQLPAGKAVQAELDNADLFVLPSRTEGLPRAMIEAMARALPCIGSEVGGIRELLTADDMFPPDDVPALAAKIREVVSAHRRMEQMSQRNLAVAGDYREEILWERRRAFYEHVRDETAAWLGKEAEAVPLPATVGFTEPTTIPGTITASPR